MSPRRFLGAAATVLAVLAVGSPAFAHIDPDPTDAQAGSEVSVGFTVQHGCDGSPTIQLDMRLPDGVSNPVAEPPIGWTGGIDGNVVTFQGGPLPDEQELTFRVRMILPPTPDATIYFPFVQRCEVGEIRWIDIPRDGSDTELDEPAPAMQLFGPVATTQPAPPHDDSIDDGPIVTVGHNDHHDDSSDDDHHRQPDDRRRACCYIAGSGVPRRRRGRRRRFSWHPVLCGLGCSDSSCGGARGAPVPPRSPMSRAGRVWRWLAGGIVVAVIVLGSGRPVSAHASLLTTNPAADSVLDIAPGEIVLRFTEPVDPTDESIRLVTADGTPVELGSVTEDRGSASLSAAITGELADGSYVVAWSAVSADSHPISGAFVFSVGAPSQGAEALIGDVLGDTTAESGSDFLLSAGRFASYAGIAALIGTLAAAVIVAPSVLNRRRLSTVLFAAGDLAMVGTLAMICAQANLIGASFVDWSAVFSTRSGQWWLARLVIVAVITALVPWRRLLDRRPAQVLAAVTSLVLFAVVAAGGHSVSGRWIGVAFTATVVHLAAMALWLGGLVLIVVVVDKSSVFSTAWRFSPLALSAVTLLAVTGFFNGWRQLGDLDSLSDSSYGRWLLIKLAVVGVVVTVAAASRWIIRNAATPVVTVQPASVGAAAATSPSNDELPLRRTLVIEVAGMVVILAATAGLTGATPPQQADATTAINATFSVVSDDQLAQIELLPAVTGGTTMHVTISSPAGSLNPADEITVTAELPAQQLGPVDIPTFPAGPNHVTTNDANFPIPGQWTVTVAARYGEFDQVVFTTDVAITNP